MTLPRLLQKRIVLWPTNFGWACLVIVIVTPLAFWTFLGESLLCQTDRKPADILVVEGWIDTPCLIAAAGEFQKGGYRSVIATGGFSAERGDSRRWGNYADVATVELIRAGVPEAKIIRAPAEFSENQRTYNSAIAVRAALEVSPAERRSVLINVFTQGPHARRSRLVYAKVLGSTFDVGVISCAPADYASRSWWKSSERAKDFIVESAGWFFELFCDSGRDWAHSETRPAASSNH